MSAIKCMNHANRKLRQLVAVLPWWRNLSKPVEFDGFKNSKFLSQSHGDLHSPLVQQDRTLRCQIGTSKLQGSRSQSVILKMAFIDFGRSKLVAKCDQFLIKRVLGYGLISQFVISNTARIWSQNATLNMDENCSLELGILREFHGGKYINHERHEKHEMGMRVV